MEVRLGSKCLRHRNRENGRCMLLLQNSTLANANACAVRRVAIYVNMAANIILLVSKVVVALLTSSLSIMASLVDG